MVQFILRGNLSHVCGMIFFLVDSNSILESKIGSTVWAKTWYLRPIQKYFQSHGGRCDQEGFEWDSLDEDEGWTQGQGGTIIELNWRSSHMYRCGQPDWKRNIWDWSSKIRWYGYAITLRSGQLIQEQWCLYKTRYITNNKEADNDWFRLESNKEGTRWFGKCWHYHNQAMNKPTNSMKKMDSLI